MKKSFYKTVTEHSEYKIPKIKGSIFIGNIFYIESKEEGERYIKTIEKKYPDASHHCYAWRYEVQMNYDIFGTAIYTSKHNKVSDAGEPTNTAGKPIMNAIEKQELHNILVVVTRYFGGTLLGVGGLIQAYSESAKQTLQHAKITETEITKTIKFSYPFDLVSIVKKTLNKYQAKTAKENYDKNVDTEISINSGYLEEFKKEIFENSQGKIKI
ncbi:MAG: YigZ family protein [candidate division SR1 bacterium]|nr:YigZ family protein [candidate division SR1 bacterium]